MNPVEALVAKIRTMSSEILLSLHGSIEAILMERGINPRKKDESHKFQSGDFAKFTDRGGRMVMIQLVRFGGKNWSGVEVDPITRKQAGGKWRVSPQFLTPADAVMTGISTTAKSSAPATTDGSW